jgi:hypothetical protein
MSTHLDDLDVDLEPELFECPEHSCKRKFKRSRSIAGHLSRVHKKSAANHPFEQRVEGAKRKSLSVVVPTTLQPANSPTSTSESEAAAAAFFAPNTHDVQLDGPTPVSRRAHGRVDMMSLWRECSHEDFVTGFFTNINLNPIVRSNDIPYPVKLLVQESTRSWAIDSSMYRAMMSALTAQQMTDNFFRNLPHKLTFYQTTDQRFAWEHLVTAFTWASIMLHQWPFRYPQIIQFCQTYLQAIEKQMGEQGGWGAFEQWANDSGQ